MVQAVGVDPEAAPRFLADLRELSGHRFVVEIPAVEVYRLSHRCHFLETSSAWRSNHWPSSQSR